jgi:RecA-family ATPase
VVAVLDVEKFKGEWVPGTVGEPVGVAVPAPAVEVVDTGAVKALKAWSEAWHSGGGVDWENPEPPPPSLLRREGRDVGPWLGAAGILAGAGAVGKTWAGLDLALRVAAGAAEWLGFGIAEPGRVVYVAAEDPKSVLAQRLHVLAKALRPEERQWALARLKVVSLAHTSPELLSVQRISRDATAEEVRGWGFGESKRWPSVSATMVERSALLDAMRKDLLEARGGPDPVRLVVLDPLARLGGSDAESENAVAARLMRELGGLADDAGAAVVVVHHTTKAARAAGTADGTGIRGASGLVDGSRWAAELTAVDEEAPADRRGERVVLLSVSKASYGRQTEPVRLWRTVDGPLRVETEGEEKQREAAERLEREARAARKSKAGEGGSSKGSKGSTRDVKAAAAGEKEEAQAREPRV